MFKYFKIACHILNGTLFLLIFKVKILKKLFVEEQTGATCWVTSQIFIKLRAEL